MALVSCASPKTILLVAVALMILLMVSVAIVAVIAVEILDFIAEVCRLSLDDEFVVDSELVLDALLKTGFDPVVVDEDGEGLAGCKVVATALILRSLGASTVDLEADEVADVVTVVVDELVGD